MRIGIDVGGSHIGLGLVNKDGKLVLKDEKKLNEIINSSLKNGLLVLKSGKNIIRFLPPIIISKKEMIKGFNRFEDVLENLI